uniref:DUF1573 domain-containing protein n=1 Tax=candidate division WOR-3 bacterium TaxID=2052148 RepID=A0A7V3ZYY8_UNCW3
MIVSSLCFFIISLVSIPEWYDFGKVEEGEVVSAIFWLKNNTNDTIKIVSIKPSCGCTYALQSSNVVKPGDSTAVDVKFNTKGYLGEVVQLVKVKYEGKNSGELYLKLKGEVIKSTLTPNELIRYMIVLIDVRDKSEFDKEHLVGSIWIDRNRFLSSVKALKIPQNTLIVLVTNEEEDKQFLELLKKEGYGNSYILKGGLPNWKRIMRETLVKKGED